MTNKKPKFNKFQQFYLDNYNKFLIVLVLLFFFSVISLGQNYVRTGELIRKDVSLKGGIAITVNTGKQFDLNQIESELNALLPSSSINLREVKFSSDRSGIIVEDDNPEDEDKIISYMDQKLGGLTSDDYNVETMGSSLGASFFREMFIALIFAFLFMGAVFFYYFRNMYATGAALISAFLDLFVTLGVITFLGVRLTSGGIAAFLMLIGYSIDTSILISTKFFKQTQKDMDKGLFEAMTTGLTMSAAGLAATGISFLLTNNATLKQIMLILVVGLVLDLFTTWIGNVYLLRRYKDGKDN